MKITPHGLKMIVSELRTCVGTSDQQRPSFSRANACLPLAEALIFRTMFDEYEYTPDPESADENGDEVVEIGLDTMLEALNIFGSGSGNVQAASERTAKRGWKDKKDEPRDDGDDAASVRAEPTKTMWSRGGDKVTIMKMVYEARGEPLKLILSVGRSFLPVALY